MALEVVKQHDTVIETTMSPRRESAVSLEPHLPDEPAAAPAHGAWLLSSLAALTMWATFFPLDWGILGWVCLVPLVLMIRLPAVTRTMYLAMYVTTAIGTLASLQWMRLGDPWMIPAWLALGTYLALYVPLFVWLSRIAVHHLRCPLGLSVPVTWVGLEFARSHFLTGFSWYFLGHSQYGWTELIQVSDLVGAYGVSFLLALSAAALASCLPATWLVRLRLIRLDQILSVSALPRRPRLTVVVAVLSVSAVLVYGGVRRSQATFVAGPRVALIQGNFTSSLKHDPQEWNQILERHRRLTGLAVREQPDIVVWPETMFRFPLLESDPAYSDEQLRDAAPGIDPRQWKNPQVRDLLTDLSSEAGAAMVVGIDRLTIEDNRLQHFNSAVFVRPGSGPTNHFDKVHRVPFGEYIPMADSLPWLHQLTPFSAGFGIEAGTSTAVFQHDRWKFTPLICFEDTVPHLVRAFVKAAIRDGRQPDLLVNLTNDGWFHGSSELDQHLVTSAFRAIECRTPLVRAVNTGISAIIDGDGVIRNPETFIDADAVLATEKIRQDVSLTESQKTSRIQLIEAARRTTFRNPETGRWHRQLNAVLVHPVPLDDRNSPYVTGGDWFAGTCGFSCLALLGFGLYDRVRRRRMPDSNAA